MAKYVDGFVLVVSKKDIDAYEKMAKGAGKIWKKYGALDYKECISEELQPDTQGMKQLGFEKLTKVKDDEVVFFSFIVYKSKKHRDSVNAKVMKDPFMKECEGQEMPFKVSKFAWGGFEVLVDA